METCVGCGIQTTGAHPYVGIGRKDLAENTGPMVAHPVCEPCWRDPAHRVHALKMHFTHLVGASAALSGARMTDAQSKAGLEIGVASV